MAASQAGVSPGDPTTSDPITFHPMQRLPQHLADPLRPFPSSEG